MHYKTFAAPNPIVGLLFYLAVGLWVIKVARNAPRKVGWGGW